MPVKPEPIYHQAESILEELSAKKMVVRFDCPICGWSSRFIFGEDPSKKTLTTGDPDPNVYHRGEVINHDTTITIDKVTHETHPDPYLEPFETFIKELNEEDSE